MLEDILPLMSNSSSELVWSIYWSGHRSYINMSRFTLLFLSKQEKERESMDSSKWGISICTVDGQRYAQTEILQNMATPVHYTFLLIYYYITFHLYSNVTKRVDC